MSLHNYIPNEFPEWASLISRLPTHSLNPPLLFLPCSQPKPNSIKRVGQDFHQVLIIRENTVSLSVNIEEMPYRWLGHDTGQRSRTQYSQWMWGKSWLCRGRMMYGRDSYVLLSSHYWTGQSSLSEATLPSATCFSNTERLWQSRPLLRCDVSHPKWLDVAQLCFSLQPARHATQA